MKTILIQGAMESEIEPYLNHFKNLKKQVINGYLFYVSEIKDAKIVIAQTGVSLMNATTSTVIAMYNFNPDIVINQGVCGAHLESLKIGDVIVGKTAVYINKFKSEVKGVGEGSDALSWTPMQNGSCRLDATKELIDKAKTLSGAKDFYFDVIGTGDLFSREADRINYIRKLHGQISEDMETVAAYKVCSEFHKQFIGFRVVSNNEFKQELGTSKENRKYCMDILSRVVIEFIEKL